MASDLQQQIERVQAKTRVLGEKYRAVKQQRDAAREEVAGLKAQLLARDSQLEQLKQQVEYLTVASAVNNTTGDLETTRAIIAGLLRDIDRCITDLLE